MELTPEQQALLESAEVQEYIQKHVQESLKPLHAKYEQKLQDKEKELQEKSLSLMSKEERVKAELELKQQEIERLEQQFKQTQLESLITQTLQQFGLSQQYRSFITGSSESEIIQKARKLSQLVSSQQQQRSSSTPAQSMRNPFAKETFSLTEQGQLFKNNPELARQLAAEAGVTL